MLKRSGYKKLIILGTIIVGLIFINFSSAKSEDKKDFSPLLDLVSPLESVLDLDDLVKSTGEARYVLLGESSHGTSEYYQWRAKITQKLITEKKFSFIAVEGDWPQIYYVNQYIKGYDSAPPDGETALLAPNRWPEWMWANKEFLELVEWLRAYNKDLPTEEKVGLYGMDMQNLNKSLKTTILALEALNVDLMLQIEQEYACLQEKGEDLIDYARAYLNTGKSCESEVQEALNNLYRAFSREELINQPELFNIKQNMLAVQYGEQYARAMAMEGPQSWNTRVFYMKETVERLSEHYGEESKGIIWAHNTHVGDARATEMPDAGIVNIGQLLREKHGEEKVFIVGFGTNEGTVIASQRWGAKREIMTIPSAISGSIENLLSEINVPDFILFLDQENIPELLMERFGHRAKGVVYNPEREEGNYVSTILPLRYNVFIFFEKTTALNPI